MENQEIYFEDVRGHPLLSRKEEQQLAKQIERGGKRGREARDRLIMCNLRLVLHYVNKLNVDERHRDDLIQEGNLGLLTAVKKFDWRQGTKFSTYATWWIRQKIRKALPTLNDVGRLPQHIWEKFWRHKRTGELTAKERDLQKADRFLRRIAPIDPMKVDDETQFEDDIAHKEMMGRVAEIFECLDERTRDAIRMRYGIGYEEPMTLKEIGDRVGLTRERSRQIIKQGITEIRHILRDSLPRT